MVKTLHSITAGGIGSIPGQGAKILHAVWHGQKKEKERNFQPICIFPTGMCLCLDTYGEPICKGLGKVIDRRLKSSTDPPKKDIRNQWQPRNHWWPVSISSFSEENVDPLAFVSSSSLSQPSPKSKYNNCQRPNVEEGAAGLSVSFPNPVHTCWYKFTRKVDWNRGFLGGSDDKESACNARDPGSIPG